MRRDEDGYESWYYVGVEEFWLIFLLVLTSGFVLGMLGTGIMLAVWF